MLHLSAFNIPIDRIIDWWCVYNLSWGLNAIQIQTENSCSFLVQCNFPCIHRALAFYVIIRIRGCLGEKTLSWVFLYFYQEHSYKTMKLYYNNNNTVIIGKGIIYISFNLGKTFKYPVQTYYNYQCCIFLPNRRCMGAFGLLWPNSSTAKQAKHNLLAVIKIGASYPKNKSSL